MQSCIDSYINYLEYEKKGKQNTIQSYKRDLKQFLNYLHSIDLFEPSNVTTSTIAKYVTYLETKGLKPSSISRSLASIRSLFKFLVANKLILNDPSFEIEKPKVVQKSPYVMDITDIEKLLSFETNNNYKSIRDKAMLELLYATGIKVSELINLKVDDINKDFSFISCKSDNKERVIPIGSKATAALKEYISNSRDILLREKTSAYLFLNFFGEQMTRQGFWKLLKFYAKKANIQYEITPHSLRHTFACHLLSNGADLLSVQKMLGHTYLRSTRVYTQIQADKLKDVYSKAHPRF